ncbi:TetR/AcrR family transcriptional regulator [Streptomyces sp. NPDC002514]|uniref:TetR/AcrR family transcriptional regulator n=1 Tax=unclassified Streptomyces TaxID=2593676 RepID=UPI0036C35619
MSRPTRERLLDAAQALLDDGGIEAVTLREVGGRAGVSHNAPYKHFASKEALLAAVAARELRRKAASFHGDRDQPAAERLRDSLHWAIARAVAHPNRFRLIYGRWPTDVAAELVHAAQEAELALIGLVAEAQEAGALPAGAEPEKLTAVLRAAVQGAAELAISGHLSLDGRAKPEAVVDDLLTLLRGPE